MDLYEQVLRYKGQGQGEMKMLSSVDRPGITQWSRFSN